MTAVHLLRQLCTREWTIAIAYTCSIMSGQVRTFVSYMYSARNCRGIHTSEVVDVYQDHIFSSLEAPIDVEQVLLSFSVTNLIGAPSILVVVTPRCVVCPCMSSSRAPSCLNVQVRNLPRLGTFTFKAFLPLPQ